MKNKNSQLDCSLLISTYNWPEALECCLNSILDQTILPNEIIIADDGSKKETKDLIALWKKKSNLSVKHVWHPDEGFRLSEIRNRAIVSANSPYIIQIDGDIIMTPKFIEDHLLSAAYGTFLCGSRVTLTEETTNKLLSGKQKRPSLFQIPLGFLFNNIRIPIISAFFAVNFRVNQIDRLRGCNMSFWKDDLLKVNGYNEDIKGWGPEDKELAVRLINSGVEKRSLKFLAIQYHLFHKETSKNSVEFNRQLLKKASFEKNKWAKNGISKHI